MKWGLAAPLELEVNSNNNGKSTTTKKGSLGGKIQLFPIGKLGIYALDINVFSTRRVQHLDVMIMTLTSTNGLGLIHCFPGMQDVG